MTEEQKKDGKALVDADPQNFKHSEVRKGRKAMRHAPAEIEAAEAWLARCVKDEEGES